MRIFVISKRTLLIIAAAALILISAVAVILAFSDSPATASAGLIEEYEAEVLAGRKKELPVYSVERNDKKIALTIDAAWEDDKTDDILAMLAERKVKATFFLCGVWVETYPDKVKAIAATGHEIGNHSLSHPHMNSLSADKIKAEITDLEKKIKKLTGQTSALFRAPYGEYNDTVVLAVREAGFEIVQWDIDTIDWREERSAKTILDTVLPKLHPGAIILCHNNGYKIREYLPTLLDTAIAEGYEFVRVSELLLDGETTIDVNGVQKPKS